MAAAADVTDSVERAPAASSTAASASRPSNTEFGPLFERVNIIQNSIVIGQATAMVERAPAASSNVASASRRFNTESGRSL